MSSACSLRKSAPHGDSPEEQPTLADTIGDSAHVGGDSSDSSSAALKYRHESEIGVHLTSVAALVHPGRRSPNRDGPCRRRSFGGDCRVPGCFQLSWEDAVHMLRTTGAWPPCRRLPRYGARIRRKGAGTHCSRRRLAELLPANNRSPSSRVVLPELVCHRKRHPPSFSNQNVA